MSSDMKGGRRVFHSALKSQPRGGMERVEVRMLAQVTARRVRTPPVETSRFPW